MKILTELLHGFLLMVLTISDHHLRVYCHHYHHHRDDSSFVQKAQELPERVHSISVVLLSL